MNWIEFFEANNIEFVNAGPNTGRGEVSVNCPFCQGEDPSHHLGVNLTSGAWACWRDATHRGRSPHRLVQALIGCSNAVGRALVRQFSYGDPDSLPALTPFSEAPKPVSGHVTFPAEFRQIEGYGLTHKFWKYLWSRGFDDPDTAINQYKLLCCMIGRWKDRLIIPVYEEENLIGFQGRALVQNPTKPRYLSSSEAIKHTIFNLDNLMEGKVLYICEGPFDAMKIDFYGQVYGCRATCAFGVSMTVDQIALMSKVSKCFDRTVVLFDADAAGPAFGLMDWLKGAEFGQLPEGIKDPGVMNRSQIRTFLGATKEK